MIKAKRVQVQPAPMSEPTAKPQAQADPCIDRLLNKYKDMAKGKDLSVESYFDSIVIGDQKQGDQHGGSTTDGAATDDESIVVHQEKGDKNTIEEEEEKGGTRDFLEMKTDFLPPNVEMLTSLNHLASD